MFHLAATMPTPILTEILGLSPSTATRWAALAARDWSAYTTQRDADLRSRDGDRRGPSWWAILRSGGWHARGAAPEGTR